MTTFGDGVSERHMDIDSDIDNEDDDGSVSDGLVDKSDVGDMEKPLVSDAEW